MHRSLTLHIGTPKSGTTYLQAILAAGRRELARSGVLYPGERYLPQAGLSQQPAVYAIGSRFIRWVDPAARENAARYYHRLCEEVSTHQGRMLISAESLAFFDPAEIHRFLDGLRADPARTHIVITARDPGRVLPSVWQQNVKNGSVEPLDDYLESVASLRGSTDAPLWTAFGLPGLVRRWQEVVGTDQVVLVTSPHRGGDTLWHRFAEAVDVPAALGLSTRTGSSALQLVDRNLSLTPIQVELLRRMNLLLQQRGDDKHDARLLRSRVLHAWMSSGDGRGSRIAVPPRLRSTVERWAAEDAEALRSNGVRIIGDVADLLPQACPPRAPDMPSTASDLEEAARSLLLLVEKAPAKVPAQPLVTSHKPSTRRRLRSAIRRVGRIRQVRRVSPAFGQGGPSAAQSNDATAAPAAVVDLSDSKQQMTSAPARGHSR